MWHGIDESHPLHGIATTSVAAEEIERTSIIVDDSIGRLVSTVGDDTAVVVFAMHGFRPADDLVATVLMPELFMRLHFGRKLLRDPDQKKWAAAGYPPIVPDPGDFVGDAVLYAFADTPVQRARRTLHRILPPAAWERVRQLAGRPNRPPLTALANPTPPEVRVVDEGALAPIRAGTEYEAAAWYRRHWPKMPYFALPSFADGHVRVNLAGREAFGIVQKEDYEAALEDATAVLRACRDPRTGAPIVADVLRMRADDPFDRDGPDADLLIIFDGAPDAIEHPTVGMIGPFPHARTSAHTDRGWAMISGPEIAPGDLGSRDAGALSATVLDLLSERPAPDGSRTLLASG
jgi:predicted AlkP superfamily phosphohydrolase/phosphomutase